MPRGAAGKQEREKEGREEEGKSEKKKIITTAECSWHPMLVICRKFNP